MVLVLYLENGISYQYLRNDRLFSEIFLLLGGNVWEILLMWLFVIMLNYRVYSLELIFNGNIGVVEGRVERALWLIFFDCD